MVVFFFKKKGGGGGLLYCVKSFYKNLDLENKI